MRYMMQSDRERRHDDRDRESSRRYENRRYDNGGSMSMMDYGSGRYEARRLPPRTSSGRFKRRNYNEEHDYGYYDDEERYDEMGRRRYRDDDWQTQGYVDRERERRYYDDMDDRRRERRSRWDDDDDDGYD